MGIAVIGCYKSNYYTNEYTSYGEIPCVMTSSHCIVIINHCFYTSNVISVLSLFSGRAPGELKLSRMLNTFTALWRYWESGMVQLIWNWNVPLTSDHTRLHLNPIGTGLDTKKKKTHTIFMPQLFKFYYMHTRIG